MSFAFLSVRFLIGVVSLFSQTRPDLREILMEYWSGHRECPEAPRYEMDLSPSSPGWRGRAWGLNVIVGEASCAHHGSDRPGSSRRCIGRMSSTSQLLKEWIQPRRSGLPRSSRALWRRDLVQLRLCTKPYPQPLLVVTELATAHTGEPFNAAKEEKRLVSALPPLRKWRLICRIEGNGACSGRHTCMAIWAIWAIRG